METWDEARQAAALAWTMVSGMSLGTSNMPQTYIPGSGGGHRIERIGLGKTVCVQIYAQTIGHLFEVFVDPESGGKDHQVK